MLPESPAREAEPSIPSGILLRMRVLPAGRRSIMPKRLNDVLGGLSHRLIPDYQPGMALPVQPSRLEVVQEAWREWQAARNYFDAVSDPDLVDHAIYLVEAAERKYGYLIKQAKAEGIEGSPPA